MQVDGNVLLPQKFLRAVSIAAQRDNQTPVVQPVAASFKNLRLSREDAIRLGRLILVAEDHEVNREVIKRQLHLLGYGVDLAVDGQEAFELWRAGHYALVITDLQMPNMDGIQLTTAIRAQDIQ